MLKFIILASLMFAGALSAPHYVSPVYEVYNYPAATSYSNRYDYYPYSKGVYGSYGLGYGGYEPNYYHNGYY